MLNISHPGMFQERDQSGIVDMALGIQVPVTNSYRMEKAEIGHGWIILELNIKPSSSDSQPFISS